MEAYKGWICKERQDSQLKAQGTFQVSKSTPSLPLAKPPTSAVTSLPVQSRLQDECLQRKGLDQSEPSCSLCSRSHRKSCSMWPNRVLPASHLLWGLGICWRGRDTAKREEYIDTGFFLERRCRPWRFYKAPCHGPAGCPSDVTGGSLSLDPFLELGDLRTHCCISTKLTWTSCH